MAWNVFFVQSLCDDVLGCSPALLGFPVTREDIIKQSGYLITPEDFQELLEEAARYLDIPQKNGSLVFSAVFTEKTLGNWKRMDFERPEVITCWFSWVDPLQDLGGSFAGFGGSFADSQFCRNPPPKPPKCFPLGEVFPLNGPAFSIWNKWLVVLLILWLSWSWEFLFRMNF